MDHKTGLGRLYRNVTPYMGSMGFRGLFLFPNLLSTQLLSTWSATQSKLVIRKAFEYFYVIPFQMDIALHIKDDICFWLFAERFLLKYEVYMIWE